MTNATRIVEGRQVQVPEIIETNVLILGAGPSGLVAAHEAALTGASVVLVDPTGEIGGNGAFSTGYMAFADTSLQRENGIRDTPELFLNDMRTEVERKRDAFEPEFDIELATRFVQESGTAFEYMADLGFGFGRFISRPHQHTVDRMVVLLKTIQFRDIFAQRLSELGVTLMLRSRARELLTTGGSVNGALIEKSSGHQTQVRASAGIVVTTGGYQASAAMRKRYQPALDSTSPYQGLDTIVGDGHTMLEAVGADLVNMHMVPELVQIASRLVEECIAVNESGRRFHDEAGPYNERLRALRRQPGSIAYFLCDARTGERHAQLLGEMPGPAKHLGSLEDVARAINAPASTLSETVARWNQIVEGGSMLDREFGRVVFPDPPIGIRTPPYTVVPMSVGSDISAGGARVSPDMEVLKVDRTPIVNVFAAGDCIGLINSAAGLGGIHLSSAVTLGRIAGKSAAA
jgi:succinate dehydrogenase/fumarate reductase flavoprotein subunit